MTVDGVDLASVDTEQMRERVGVAFQDTFIFDATLRENLTLGVEDVDDEVLDRVIVESGLDRIVERLPHGLATELTADGVTLSAGEIQRVGIARALLRDPELLLLDEVASGLDPVTEARLTEAIEDLRVGRTVISVTHRLESIKTADLIAVIDAGRVVETGSFGELLDRDGTFATMWAKQHGFDVAANGLSARVHAERLRAIPIFADLDEAVLADLAATFVSQHVTPGDVVFREGERGDAFFVIARGVVEVVRGLGTDGEAVVAYLEDGDFFGEMALLSNQRRNAGVRARTPTTLLRLDRHAFNQLLATVPEAAAAVEAVAARRAEENAAVPEPI